MVLKAQSTNRKNKNSSDVELLDVCDTDDEGFIEGDISTGKVLSTFSFGMSAAPDDNRSSAIPAPAQSKSNEILSLQNQPYSSAPRGLTPPINGENFTVKRSYAMRPSTVRKLNALKAEHPDVNMLFNTIVDVAISHYYNYIFNDNGTSSIQEEKKINS
ncbi:MAG: hypothetical protein Q8936_19590 [Bacillota bacterium]|nr:hypothetical protein [Bacillota bacterium]